MYSPHFHTYPDEALCRLRNDRQVPELHLRQELPLLLRRTEAEAETHTKAPSPEQEEGEPGTGSTLKRQLVATLEPFLYFPTTHSTLPSHFGLGSYRVNT